MRASQALTEKLGISKLEQEEKVKLDAKKKGVAELEERMKYCKQGSRNVELQQRDLQATVADIQTALGTGVSGFGGCGDAFPGQDYLESEVSVVVR